MVTVTLLTPPVIPLTVTVEGYVVAGPWLGMMMTLPFVNALLALTVNANVTVPRFCPPSCNCNVAVIVLPAAPPTMKLKGRDTVAPLATRAPNDWDEPGEEMPPPGSNVATRSAVSAVPTLRRPKLMVAVSPGSKEPLAGGGFSLRSAVPEATINGDRGLTFNVTFVVLFARLESDVGVTIENVWTAAPVVVGLNTIVALAPTPFDKVLKSEMSTPPRFVAQPRALNPETNSHPGGRTLVT